MRIEPIPIVLTYQLSYPLDHYEMKLVNTHKSAPKGLTKFAMNSAAQ